MGGANGKGDQVGIERVSGVFAEKFCVGGEESGMENFENAGEVDFRVFGVGMITVNEEGSGGQKQQDEDALDGNCKIVQVHRVACIRITTENLDGWKDSPRGSWRRTR